MNGLAEEVIRLVAEQIEKLTIHEGGHEIESAVRIRKDHKQCRLLVAQGIKFQFVICHQVPELFDIEKGQYVSPQEINMLLSVSCPPPS